MHVWTIVCVHKIFGMYEYPVCVSVCVKHLAEALGLVHAGTMNEQWVEEHCVSLLHLQVNTRMAGVVVTHTMVHLIDSSLQTDTRELWSMTERERESVCNACKRKKMENENKQSFSLALVICLKDSTVLQIQNKA